MLKSRSAMCAVTLNNRILAVGGFHGERSLDSVEVYNPDTQRWEEGTPMNSPRCAAAATVLDGFVYGECTRCYWFFAF